MYVSANEQMFEAFSLIGEEIERRGGKVYPVRWHGNSSYMFFDDIDYDVEHINIVAACLFYGGQYVSVRTWLAFGGMEYVDEAEKLKDILNDIDNLQSVLDPEGVMSLHIDISPLRGVRLFDSRRIHTESDLECAIVDAAKQIEQWFYGEHMKNIKRLDREVGEVLIVNGYDPKSMWYEPTFVDDMESGEWI